MVIILRLRVPPDRGIIPVRQRAKITMVLLSLLILRRLIDLLKSKLAEMVLILVKLLLGIARAVTPQSLKGAPVRMLIFLLCLIICTALILGLIICVCSLTV